MFLLWRNIITRDNISQQASRGTVCLERMPGMYLILYGGPAEMLTETYSAEAVAGMIKAKVTGEEWSIPKWLPESYLTWAKED
jgi:hypothetical protein